MPTISDLDIEAIVEWVLAAIGGLGFLLPIGIFVLANLFSRARKSRTAGDRPAQPQSSAPPQSERRPPWTTMQPMPSFPNGPVTWTGPAAPAPERPAARKARTGWGSAFDDNDTARALQWGSAFDDNDAEKRDHALQWGSAFERERPTWGWDETEWGSGFATRKDSEPRITVG